MSQEFRTYYRAVALVAVAALISVACVSAPPETRCYQAVNGIAVSVDAAMKITADLYAAGRVPSADGKSWVVSDPTKILVSDAQKDKVLALHGKYQLAISAAGHGCMGLQDAKDIGQLTADAVAALGDLLSFVNSLKRGGV